MKPFALRNRPTIFAMLVLISFIGQLACSGSEPAKKSESLVSDTPAGPAFLAEIPADTPYAFVSLDAVPLETIMPRIEAIGDFMDFMLEEAQKTAPADTPDMQIISQLKGTLSKEGLTQMGLSMNPRFGFYGVGFLPVFRMSLEDTDAFQNWLDQLLGRVGTPLQNATHDGQTYQYYEEQEDRVAISYRDDEVLIGFFPKAAEDLYLPHFLGRSEIEAPISETELFTSLKDQYGLLGFGLGFLDLRKVIDAMLSDGTSLNARTLSALGALAPADLSEVCRTEFRNTVDKFPRIIAGTQTFTRDEIRTRVGLETTTTLGTDLKNAAGVAPGYAAPVAQEAPFRFGIGLSVGSVLNALGTYGRALRNDPFQCEGLASINGWAEQLTQASVMVPGPVTQIEGLHVVLNSVTFDEAEEAQPANPDDPNAINVGFPAVNLKGLALLGTSAPEQAWNTLQLLAPGLRNVEIQPNSIPVALPDLSHFEYFVDPHLVMTESALGLSSGEESRFATVDALGEAPDPEQPLAFVTLRPEFMFRLLAEESTSAMSQHATVLGEMTYELRAQPDAVFVDLKQSWYDAP